MSGSGAGGMVEGLLELPPPIKNSSTRKQFRCLRLPSGLKVLLVHDYRPTEECAGEEEDMEEEEEMEVEEEGDEEDEEDGDDDEGGEERGDKQQMAFVAGAALSIEAGSLSDPENCQGLMHLLEHMVFMGSKKYPTENDFDGYVSKRGGFSNAFTGDELTNFYFEVQCKHLWSALDRFAQFFIEPLMVKSAIEREIKAVDSEANEAKAKDHNRSEYVIRKLAPKDHPASFHCYGDIKSLGCHGYDYLYDTLHEYRKRFYLPSMMNLVVLSRDSLDVMQENVVRIFSAMQPCPSASLPPCPTPLQVTKYNTLRNPYPPSAVNKLVKVRALEAKQVLDLTWYCPPLEPKKDYTSAPYNFIAAVMGHEGKGSLLSYLKEHNLAYELETDSGMSAEWGNSLYTHYTVSLRLTEAGLGRAAEAVRAVLAYVAMMGVPPRGVFDDLSAIARESFECGVDDEGGDYVEAMASAMSMYRTEDLMKARSCFFEYRPEAIQRLVEWLSPDNMCVCLTAKFADEDMAELHTEPWFGAQYSIEDFPEEWKAQFRTPLPNHGGMHLPLPNKYLDPNHPPFPPTWPHPERQVYPSPVPSTLPRTHVWSNAVNNYGLPLCRVRLNFRFPPASASRPRFRASVALLLSVLETVCQEEGYEAELAKYSKTWSYTSRGLQLTSEGFAAKYREYLDMLLRPLKAGCFDDACVNSRKEVMLRGLYDRCVSPSAVAEDLLTAALTPGTQLPHQTLQQLSGILPQQLRDTAAHLLDDTTVQMLVQGVGADELSSTLLPALSPHFPRGAAPPAPEPIKGFRRLPVGSSTLQLAPVNLSNGNSVICSYYQGPAGSLRGQVLMELLELAVQEPCFDVLRTQQQLSYVVHSHYKESGGVLGYVFTIEPMADKFSLEEVDARIEAFLAATGESIRTMSEDELATLQETLLTRLTRVDESLRHEVRRNWDEVTTQELLFDRRQKQVPLVETVTLQELYDTYSSLFLPGPTRRKLSIRIPGCPEPEKHCPPDMATLQEKGVDFLQLSPKEDTDEKDLQAFLDNLDVHDFHPIVE